MTKKKNSKKKKSSIQKYWKKIKNSKTKFSLSEMLTITVISILIGVLLGSSTLYHSENITVSNNSEELEEFITTYNNISENYYDKVKKEDLLNAAIKGMINSLDDPYSEFLENEDSTTFNESVDGEYVGIGATVSYDGTSFKIEEMSDSSPAKKAGLKIGDQIIKVADKKVQGLSLSDLSKLIKGKSGTKVTIKVLRDEEEKEFTVKRSKISIPSVTSKVIKKEDKKIGYIAIEIFSSNTDKEFEETLEKLESKKINSLIIDVRDNPGGHLLQVTNILELFMPKDKVLYQIERKQEIKKIKDTTKDSRKYDIVVLINNSSASASEILASSLKESYKAKLVGLKTYGKGTVQNAYELSDGSTLKYTTQKWLTAKGEWINQIGVSPDYEVSLSDEYYENPTDENDNQLQKAIEILTSKEEEKTK